jgi:hypothetical protein
MKLYWFEMIRFTGIDFEDWKNIKSPFFFDLRGVSGPAYAHHDYSPRPTGHPASLGAGKAPRGWQACT